MLGNNIKALRIKNGYSQQELADKLNVSRQTVSSWEVNRTEPTMGNIESMSKIFHCLKSELIGESAPPYVSFISKGTEVSITKRELIELIHGMSDDQASATLTFIRGTKDFAQNVLNNIDLKKTIEHSKST